jgi:hypothetical protein
MDNRDNKGGEHGARSSTPFHGAYDQGLSSFAAVKLQNSQVLSTCSRSEINHFSPDGPTQVPICRHMQRTLRQMVGV